MAGDALYAYAVLPEGAAPPAGVPAILPGAGFVLVGDAPCQVLASPVPRAPFLDGPEGRLADPDWFADRAQAHHGVVAACAAAGPVLPLTFGALFSSAALLRDWLAPRATALAAALGHVAGCAEWSLALEEDAQGHAAWLDAHDPALRALGIRIAAAGEGTAFLLGRRRDQALKQARSARLAALSDRLRQRLEAHARAMPAAMTALVEDGRRAALERELADIRGELAGTGLTLRLAGPWPAYASARAALVDG